MRKTSLAAFWVAAVLGAILTPSNEQWLIVTVGLIVGTVAYFTVDALMERSARASQRPLSPADRADADAQREPLTARRVLERIRDGAFLVALALGAAAVVALIMRWLYA